MKWRSEEEGENCPRRQEGEGLKDSENVVNVHELYKIDIKAMINPLL